VLPAEDVAEVVRGIEDRGVLPQCDAVLSGYQGAEDVGATILEAVELVRSRNPRAIYCCDPVMGDVDRGVYVRPGIPDFMRDTVVPAAQVITPNQFELGLITGLPTTTVEEVIAAADAARGLGPETVLVTSVIIAGDTDQLSMIMVTGGGAWSVTTPLLPQTFTGAGDLTAAVFLGGLLTRDDPVEALADTAAVAYEVLSTTAALGSRELQLVAAQDRIAAPQRRFEVCRLR
jgi:pyridoxine kinase